MNISTTKNGLGTRQMVLIAMFVVLIAVGGFIKIPVPPVPISLQSLFVLLAGALLGSTYGSAAVAVYIVLGLIGLPIFTSGGGIAYVLKPSFGYILGFIPAAYITGLLTHKALKMQTKPENGAKQTFLRIFAANLAGTAVIYVFGLIYLYFVMKLHIGKDLEILNLAYTGMIIFLPGDLAKCFLSTITAEKLAPIINR